MYYVIISILSSNQYNYIKYNTRTKNMTCCYFIFKQDLPATGNLEKLTGICDPNISNNFDSLSSYPT